MGSVLAREISINFLKPLYINRFPGNFPRQPHSFLPKVAGAPYRPRVPTWQCDGVKLQGTGTWIPVPALSNQPEILNQDLLLLEHPYLTNTADNGILHSPDVKINNRWETRLANCKVQCKPKRIPFSSHVFREGCLSARAKPPVSLNLLSGDIPLQRRLPLSVASPRPSASPPPPHSYLPLPPFLSCCFLFHFCLLPERSLTFLSPPLCFLYRGDISH